MASKMLDHVDPESSGLRLSDDILYFLAKYFLNNTDCLALALSGSSESFTTILGSRINVKKKLPISLCYFITPIPWKSFFQQQIQSLVITTFDCGHCYWLSPEDVSSTVTQMINLEELIIHDTKISLAHLPNIFSACQKVVKLSFSLAEKNLDQYQENVMVKASFDGMVRGFQQLTHVKIFALAPSDYSIDSWPVIFGVLKWCCLCIDLQIEVAYIYPCTREYRPPADLNMHNAGVLESLRSELFPQLGWMSSLKSLIFIKRGQYLHIHPRYDGHFFTTFINWLLDDRRPELARLWITWDDRRDFLTYLQSSPENSTVLSSVLLTTDRLNNLEALNESTTQRLRRLQRLGGIIVTRLGYMPELNYVRGLCMFDYQGLNQFCESHPMIENLHFDTSFAPDTYTMTNSVWNLPKLKTVVLRSGYPVKGILDKLINSGPMIESLHLDCTQEYFTANPLEKYEFLSAIRFQHLHSLSLNGFPLADGSYLLPIVKQCPRLERLHISGIFEKATFLSKLGECLPLATKLRDFRFQWISFENDSAVEDFLTKLLKCSSHLKRLVLDDQRDYDRDTPAHHPHYDMGDFLFNFISKMELLVALCFTSFRVHPDVFKELNRRVTEEIVPLRPPSFWFHLGPKPPNANDHSVPRIHSDEIVHPIDWFYSPPKFDWYCPPGNL